MCKSFAIWYNHKEGYYKKEYKELEEQGISVAFSLIQRPKQYRKPVSFYLDIGLMLPIVGTQPPLTFNTLSLYIPNIPSDKFRHLCKDITYMLRDKKILIDIFNEDCGLFLPPKEPDQFIVERESKKNTLICCENMLHEDFCKINTIEGGKGLIVKFLLNDYINDIGNLDKYSIKNKKFIYFRLRLNLSKRKHYNTFYDKTSNHRNKTMALISPIHSSENISFQINTFRNLPPYVVGKFKKATFSKIFFLFTTTDDYSIKHYINKMTGCNYVSKYMISKYIQSKSKGFITYVFCINQTGDEKSDNFFIFLQSSKQIVKGLLLSFYAIILSAIGGLLPKIIDIIFQYIKNIK